MVPEYLITMASESSHAGEMLFDDLFDELGGQDEVAEKALENDVWVRHRVAAAQCDADVVLSKSVLTRTVVAAVQRAVAFLLAGQHKIGSLEQLGQQLAAQFGWRVVMRCGTVGKHTPQQVNFSTVRHSFLICNPLPGLDVIVDPGFRRMFQVGNPSRHYLAFMASSIPEVFVGTMEMLMPLVATAAAAIATSFAELAMPLPPWRQVASLKSHWQPPVFSESVCHAPPSLSSSLDLDDPVKTPSSRSSAQLSTSADAASRGLRSIASRPAGLPQPAEVSTASTAASGSRGVGGGCRKGAGVHGSVPGRRSLRLPCKVMQRETPRRFEFTPLALSRHACTDVQAVDWVKAV